MGYIKKLKRFVLDESGPTAVEYAVMLALIIIACIGSVGLLSTAARASLDASSDAIGSHL